jgi:hypothetical protein
MASLLKNTPCLWFDDQAEKMRRAYEEGAHAPAQT